MKKNQLPRCTPESQGISSAALVEFTHRVENEIHELHSFMLLRRGQVVAEAWWSPYGPRRRHMLFSLTKSFTSTAVGLAVSEGRLSVDDPVISFFPHDLPAQVSPNLAAMKVRHLLSMSVGHHGDTTDLMFSQPEGNLTKGFLALPVEYEPGTHFQYNSGASHMLATIVTQLTGQPLAEYLRPRLFEPLGIQNPLWQTDPRGVNIGGWGLHLTTEDIARFGQLYLQKGVWNGQQLVPANWVETATSKKISNGTNPNSDWEQGYCFQFWRCRHNAYRGDGAFGQFCVVMPEQECVLALTGGMQEMQPVLDLVWECLLPAMGTDPLPTNPSAQVDLQQQAAGLAYLPPAGPLSSALESKLSGRRFRLEPNADGAKGIAFDFTPAGCLVTVLSTGRTQQVRCGRGQWLEGWTSLLLDRRARVAASAIWSNKNTLVITQRFYETPFYHTWTCRFDGDRVSIQRVANVAFGPTESAPLLGRAIAEPR